MFYQMLFLKILAFVGVNWVTMADPARIKTDDTCEKTTTATEEPTPEETDDVSATAKPTQENKEAPSQDQPRQDVKPVSLVYRNTFLKK